MIAETRGEQEREFIVAIHYVPSPRWLIRALPPWTSPGCQRTKPLFAGGRSAFVPNGDQVVVHGGLSVEELVVPVKVSELNGVG